MIILTDKESQSRRMLHQSTISLQQQILRQQLLQIPPQQQRPLQQPTVTRKTPTSILSEEDKDKDEDKDKVKDEMAADSNAVAAVQVSTETPPHRQLEILHPPHHLPLPPHPRLLLERAVGIDGLVIRA